MSIFNAQEYWADKPVKKWVVWLERRRGRKVLKDDIKIVSARTERGAKDTAVANSMIEPTHIRSCQLATPWDLGCTPTAA